MTHARRLAAPALTVPILLTACSTPFTDDYTVSLRDDTLSRIEADINAAAQGEPTAFTPESRPSSLGFTDERLRELNATTGPGAYTIDDAPDYGVDLLGETNLRTTPLTLDEALTTALANNLDVQVARFAPAISRQATIAADAAFDIALFADLTWNVTDEPTFARPPLQIGANQSQALAWNTGLRKQTRLGTQLEGSIGGTYTDNDDDLVEVTPDPGYRGTLNASVTQPLLRGFGTAVNTAQVRLNENQTAQDLEVLRSQIIDTLVDVEAAYWDLLLAQRTLLIQKRLLDRGIAVRDVLRDRIKFDARPAEVADAVANVESRRAALIRAQRTVRNASDRLKLLLRDADLPIPSESIIIPTTPLLTEAVEIELLDAVRSAMRNRPELAQAVLGVEAVGIRLDVAENATLPDLNLAFSITSQGLDEDDEADDAYADAFSGRFVSTVLGATFERALGNRAAEADLLGARLDRLRAITTYRNIVRSVLLETKTALRDVETNYRLIAQTREARLAAAENLRVIEVQKRTIASLTPEFLDLELRRQEALASAETQEISAIVDYNIALARLAAATATSLDQRGIEVVEPDPDELLQDSPYRERYD